MSQRNSREYSLFGVPGSAGRHKAELGIEGRRRPCFPGSLISRSRVCCPIIQRTDLVLRGRDSTSNEVSSKDSHSSFVSIIPLTELKRV